MPFPIHPYSKLHRTCLNSLSSLPYRTTLTGRMPPGLSSVAIGAQLQFHVAAVFGLHLKDRSLEEK